MLRMAESNSPWVCILMGSKTDWEFLSPARDVLDELKVPHEVRIISAHRAPDELFAYVQAAEERGIQVIVAGAGGAAHLPGMIAAKTLLPVIGVPVPSTSLNGLDSLLSIVQMPRGTPVATMAIGKAGAANAALFAAMIIGRTRSDLMDRLRAWRAARRAELLADSQPVK